MDLAGGAEGSRKAVQAKAVLAQGRITRLVREHPKHVRSYSFNEVALSTAIRATRVAQRLCLMLNRDLLDGVHECRGGVHDVAKNA